MSFGLRLRNLRKKTNLSQLNLGKKIGVSGTAISQYESDLRFPDQDVLIKLCIFFDISADYLLGLSQVEFPPLKYGKLVLDSDSFTEDQFETIILLIKSFQKINKKKKE